MTTMEPTRWEVTMRQYIKLPRRRGFEPVDRIFTVNARTSGGALRAVQNAGHKGIIMSVLSTAGVPA